MSNKKSISAIIVFLSFVISVGGLFVGCKKELDEIHYEDEKISDGIAVFSNIEYDDPKGESIIRGAEKYAEENGMPFKSFDFASFNEDEIKNSITDSVTGNLKIIICVGYEYSDIVDEMSDIFTEAEFILIDAFVLEEKTNVKTLTADTFDAAFVGYLNAKSGYRTVGFLGGVKTDTSLNCAEGYISGICAASVDYRDENFDVTVSYVDTLVCDDTTVSEASSLYKNGCKSILAYGGAALLDCATAAEEYGASMCGINTELSSESFEFAVCLDYEKAIYHVLEKGQDNVKTDDIIYIKACDECFYVCVGDKESKRELCDLFDKAISVLSDDDVLLNEISLENGIFPNYDNVTVNY